VTQQQFQAAVFDMDGVLFDSEPLHIKAWQAVMAALEIELPYAVIARCIGIPDEDTAIFVQRYYGTETPAEVLLAQKRAIYPEMAAAVVTAFPGVGDGLAQLSARVPIALATSCHIPETELLLEHTGLLPYFPLRVTAESVSARKPAPDPFLKAMELLGSRPTHTLAVEDSRAGVAAAKAAGCTVLAIMSSHSADQLAEADHVFPTTADALAWMLEVVVTDRR
jgi:HAD superfamily hydrolase (TIGR01509 family)